GHGDPGLEESPPGLPVRLPIEVAEGFLEPVSFGEVGVALKRLLEEVSLFIGEAVGVLENQKAGALDGLVGAPFAAPDGVERIAKDLSDVEAVEGHRRLGQMLPDAFLKGIREHLPEAAVTFD